MIELFNLHVAPAVHIKKSQYVKGAVGNVTAPVCIAGQPTRNRE